MKQKLFTLTTACLLTIGVAQAQTWQIGSPNAEDVTAILQDGVLTISGTGEMQNWDYTHPQLQSPLWGLGIKEIKIKFGVTSIGEEAFPEYSNLTSVELPEGITSIGRNAFWDCPNLSSINIPESVTYIGEVAFGKCVSLTSITIPENIENIGLQCFFECKNLKTINYNAITCTNSVWDEFMRYNPTTINIGKNVEQLPELIGNVGYFRFPNITFTFNAENTTFVVKDSLTVDINKNTIVWFPKNLKNLIIPEGVTYIEGNIFANVYGQFQPPGLFSITIPESVTNIASQAFVNHNRLETINYNAINCKISDFRIDQNGDTIVGNSMPLQITSGFRPFTLTIGNKVEIIPEQVFMTCNTLTEITIPASVTSIGERAFSGYLKTVTCLNPIPPTISQQTFSSPYDKTLFVPEGSVNDYKNAIGWKDFGTITTALIFGCTDTTALNYNPNATIKDNSCVYAPTEITGCMNPAALNYNPNATIASNTCEYNTISQNTEIEGCTDTTARNFNPVATVNNESCVYDKDVEITGCMQKMALNYNANATIANGSCVYANPENMYVNNDFSKPAIEEFASIIKDFCNFDYSQPIDTAYIANLQEIGNGVFAAKWVVVQNGKEKIIETTYNGKTENAVYYLSLICNMATMLKANNEVKAITICVRYKEAEAQHTIGCMDINAKNYNPNADINDVTTCEYNPITAVETRRATSLQVYPNPTTGIININATGEIKVNNSLGTLLFTTFGSQVDLSGYANGIYVIRANGKQVKVIKQ